jgi:FAD:protein FMN transferase
MQTLKFLAMGSSMTALLDADEPSSRSTLRQVQQWFEEWETVLSRFRPESELNRIPSFGHPALASDILCEVVQESLRAAEATNGLVNPLVRDALCAAGYDRTFELLGDDKASVNLAAPRVPDWRGILCDLARHTVQLPEGAHMDLGGIAKGWAADRAADRLSEEGPALVEAGGDIAVTGPRRDGSPWPVGVFNPFSEAAPLLTIALETGGVATSGRDYRKWAGNGISRHHIIDPRTGESARTNVLTATVAAPSARRAEAAAKAALILGAEAGAAWLDSQPDLAGMLVLEDRRIIYSRTFPDVVWH